MEHFKGTKATTRGHGGNRLRCRREVSGLRNNTDYNKATSHGSFWKNYSLGFTSDRFKAFIFMRMDFKMCMSRLL